MTHKNPLAPPVPCPSQALILGWLEIILARPGACDALQGVSQEMVFVGVPAFLLAPILGFWLTGTSGKRGCGLALFVLPASWFVGAFAESYSMDAIHLSRFAGLLVGALIGGLTSLMLLQAEAWRRAQEERTS